MTGILDHSEWPVFRHRPIGVHIAIHPFEIRECRVRPWTRPRALVARALCSLDDAIERAVRAIRLDETCGIARRSLVSRQK